MVVDNQNMRKVLEDFPSQCKEALSLAKGIKVGKHFNKIVLCGMGGSGIGGDLLKAYMFDKSLPVFVVKDYEMPGFIDKTTLVFAASYSGNTEETLSALTQAKNNGAHIIAITSGGKLIDLADTVIRIPTGLQPRNAVGYLFFPIIGILYNSGILTVKNNELNEMLQVLSDVASYDEAGRQLAIKIKDKMPVIYASSKFEPCAYRFKCEINENAKMPSCYHLFPEMCHNELVGYAGMIRSKFIAIIMRSKLDHVRNKKRMDICKALFDETVDVEEIEARGDGLLAQMFSLIYLGDWVSYHLAVWKRTDPTPVYVIENLKKQLTE